MIYYIEKDGKIVAADEDFEKLKRTQQIRKEIAGLAIKETERPIVNFEFADTPEYLKQARLKQIDEEIEQVESDYAAYLDSEVTYTNGKTYRVRYAEESYQALISAETSLQMFKAGMSEEEAAAVQSNFPLKIWDSTKLEENAINMTFGELVTLALFLKNLQQTSWDSRKERIAELEEERRLLINESEE